MTHFSGLWRTGKCLLFENSIVCQVCWYRIFLFGEYITFAWGITPPCSVLECFYSPGFFHWFSLIFRGVSVAFCFLWRVWSWLRMNAGGVLNTCKSNDEAQLAGWISGERVSNTWVTCPRLWDKPGKLGLIPDMTSYRMVGCWKIYRWGMDSRPISLLVR